MAQVGHDRDVPPANLLHIAEQLMQLVRVVISRETLACACGESGVGVVVNGDKLFRISAQPVWPAWPFQQQ